jgi:hypothetical protein
VENLPDPMVTVLNDICTSHRAVGAPPLAIEEKLKKQ